MSNLSIRPQNKITIQSRWDLVGHFKIVRSVHFSESRGLDKLMALDNDPHGQFAYVYGILNADDQFNNVRNLVGQSRPVDDNATLAEKSKLFRDKGNKSYQKKDFNRALSEYCHSILSGPFENEFAREVALGLGNRSAVFFELRNFQQTLDDITAAIRFGFPEELRYKLYDREARSYLELGQGKKCKESIAKAMTALKKAKITEDKRQSLTKELQTLLDEPEINKIQKKIIHTDEPFQIWERNKSFPNMSDSIGIEYSEVFGRHTVAASDIQAGEPILIEYPLASHLSPYKRGVKCSHCFHPLDHSVLPSPLNRKVRFCSLTCLDNAMSSYHRVESKMDITDIFYSEKDETQLSGCISLAYRAITQKDLGFFVKNRKRWFAHHDTQFGVNGDMTSKPDENDEGYR